MKTVEVPEIAVLDCGIPRRYLAFNLTKLKKYEEYKNQYRQCCQFTKNLSVAIDRGISLCLFGASSDFRKYAFYGIIKAAIAQKKGVRIAEIDDLVQAHSDKSEMWQQCLSVAVLGIPELEMPETVANNYYKAIVYKLLKSRIDSSKVTVVGTSLELKHPEHSVDLLYPGVGSLLVEHSVLINFDSHRTCDWLTKGHKIKLDSMGEVVAKKKSFKIRMPL